MKHAIIDAGIVVNVVVADPTHAATMGWIEAPAHVGIGWTYDDGDWIAPAVDPEPVNYPPLSGRQLLLGLRSIGITAEMVVAQIMALAEAQLVAAQAIPDETERQAAIDQIELERDLALIEWQHAGQYERDHVLLNNVATALELDSSEVDTLWLWAAAF